jgi:pyruvate/2-oxoglutarate dehydrogenase complex dihydrolipoamide dehydrogenase (E3) component
MGMTRTDEADFIIIGSGQAGVPLATRLAHAGHRVLLVERAELGGTCTNYGCTPTKTMVASARAAHVARTGGRLGVHAAEVRVDLAAVVARKDAIVRRWREGVAHRIAEASSRLQLLQGSARFVAERQIEVRGQRYRAQQVIINVGARPQVPAIQGLDAAPWLDNHRLMELRTLPRRLLVMGGGYIGCEFGQMFRRFGAEVAMVDHNHHLLAREDPEVSAAVEAVFRSEGIVLRTGSEIASVARAGDDVVLRLPDEELRGSHLLVATGRRPNTDDLACDRAGIALDPNGYVVVGNQYQTSAPGVYAVGDATLGPQFTHSAWDDHRLLFEILNGRPGRGRSDRIVPSTVFTDPQVAHVGVREVEARKRGLRFESATMAFGQVARAIETDQTAGVMKVLIDAADERLLGATIVGAEAGELIHIFVPLLQAGSNARPIVDAEFVHPTFAEGVQSLVMSLSRYALG